MEHELGADRAVIIVSALVAILSSSISVSKDNISTEECLCRDACSSVRLKLSQLLNGEMSWKENSSLDTALSYSNRVVVFSSGKRE